ncbi:MAG: M20/M25/M40 family metallo-hydrolase, partial [Paracoccus sp. (in: a-proteobacteria)]|nr:M20/M25/M40 family metallo-hydrolase [Paracoccus sp. (in: a-proteobacteria)]
MQDDRLEQVLGTLDQGLENAIGRLREFVAIPSISTDPAYAGDVRRAAEWLAAELADIGFDASVHDTDGHPMVVAHSPPSSGRSYLFYGHYDVQPVDPLELWDAPPFEMTLEEGAEGRVMRGRGTSDDKGQLMTFVEAFRAWKEVYGALPEGIVILAEGEEESGSPSLVPFLEANRDLLRADLAMICDTTLYSDGRPAITTQLRGMLTQEITVRGADRDLHSGSFGGLAANPIQILCNALGALKDDKGRVTLEGFYDGVGDLPEPLAQDWDALDFDAEAFLGEVGLRHPIGEEGRRPLEMAWARPTAEINGITGGYTGEGFKTVLPAEARA